MPLQVWLPLTGHLENQGLSDITVTNNGATVDSNGKLGGCYYFNGNNNYITATNYANLGDTFTVSMWFNSTAVNGDRGLCCDRTVPYAGFTAYLSNGKLIIDPCASSYGSSTRWTTSFTATANTWYHLVIIRTPTDISYYVNGVLGQSKSVAFADSYGNCFSIGAFQRSGASYGTYYYGKINDVRIYDHALSAKEVKLLSQGLVAHYTLGDRPCDNILTNSTGYNGTTNWSGVISVATENDTPYFIAKRTDTTSTSRTFISHTAITSYVSSWATGDKFTISGYYRVPSSETYDVTANLFIRWGASSGTSDTGFYTPSPASVIKDTWIRFEYTYSVPSSYTSGSAVSFNLSAFSKGLSTVHWKYVKLEKGDKATAWCPNSADAEYSKMGYDNTTVYDSSGYNYHGTINTDMTVSNDSARYSVSTNFDGDGNSILIPFNDMLGITTASKVDYTISVWTYKTAIGSKAYQTILGGQSGFELEARNSSGTDPQYVGWNWGKPTASYEFNKWNLFTFVHTTSDCKIYVNGEYISSGSSANIPIGDFFIGSWQTNVKQNYQGLMSDFRIYATALSADDIKELYQTSASIDKDGNLYAYELQEG